MPVKNPLGSLGAVRLPSAATAQVMAQVVPVLLEKVPYGTFSRSDKARLCRAFVLHIVSSKLNKYLCSVSTCMGYSRPGSLSMVFSLLTEIHW